VTKFFSYLSFHPASQVDWHRRRVMCRSPYAAYEVTKEGRLLRKVPGADIAVRQLGPTRRPTPNSRAAFRHYVRVARLIEEEMEGVFAGKKDAKTAMEDAAFARQTRSAEIPGGEQKLTRAKGAGPLITREWKSALYSARRGCLTRSSSRRSAVTIVFFFWRRRRPSGSPSSCRMLRHQHRSSRGCANSHRPSEGRALSSRPSRARRYSACWSP